MYKEYTKLNQLLDRKKDIDENLNRQPNMNTSNLIYLYKIDKNVTIFIQI